MLNQNLKLSSTRRYAKNLFSVLVVALLYGQPLQAERYGIAVVTGKGSQVAQLSREEIAELFLGKRNSVQNISVMPIDNQDSALRERFYMSIAEMSNLRVKAYWSRIVFSGQGRPPQEASMEEGISRVINERETLFYLPQEHVTNKMQIVFTIP